MTLEGLIRELIGRGCGLSLSEAQERNDFSSLSRGFADLKSQEEVVARQAGHLEMGALFNLAMENEALKSAKPREGSTFDPPTAAMIEIFGREIIRAAEDCLPEEVVILAGEWRRNDAEGQIKIARQVFEIFAPPDIGEDIDKIAESTRRKLAKGSGPQNYLPKVFGPWREDHPATCVGIAEMIGAFASLCGAEALYFAPVKSMLSSVLRSFDALADEIMADIRARNLTESSPMLNRALEAYNFRRLQRQNFFHVAAAIRLADGRWLALDPFFQCFGVFEPDWEIQRLSEFLRKYRFALPGLSLIADDRGRLDKLLEERMGKALALIELSKEVEKAAAEAQNASFAIIDFLVRNSHVQKLFEFDEESGKFLTDENSRLMFLMSVFGGEYFLPPDFLESGKVANWLTFYHSQASHLLDQHLQRDSGLIHPICEFGNLNYHIGAAILNNASIDCGLYLRERFSDYLFCQTTLFNSVVGGNRLAMEAAASIPFRHPELERVLTGRRWT